ncbi:nitroreductase family protein [Cuneatibacter sp. NSJ-177]|uniref:nitroreductase family protein n=1 Tax=Cuneatibacter sp. NSJ-177 TaxID=2931401 RepID=UPI001FD2DDC8|nr:nitroreductase family protein [Cuneatibacter sp. NSJ-177]MCJ7834926.1 nitroreductase family protein [Cuneatibacter sp. NSJ-177]
MPLTSKELLEESRKRRTYRSFLEEPVDLEVIKDCILTAGTAPSGADKQPWHFCVVTDPEMKKKIREQAEEVEKDFYQNKISDEWRADLAKLEVNWEKPFLTQAPCLIVIFKEFYRTLPDGTQDKNYYVPESAGISIGFLINAIRNAGYASLTYTPAPPAFLRTLLGRPEGETPVMVLCVGKPDPNYELPKLRKKTLEEIATFI